MFEEASHAQFVSRIFGEFWRPLALLDYLELVDWTGRAIRDDKPGSISDKTPNLLSVLDLESETWIDLASRFGKDCHGAVGSLEELASFAEHTGKRWISGKKKLQRMLTF